MELQSQILIMMAIMNLWSQVLDIQICLLVSKWQIQNLVSDRKFALPKRSTIGVAACDIDGDGFEEIYFLNTDTYSGNKQLDSLLDADKEFFDLFKLDKNSKNLNLTAGRSVACVDRNGNGKYGVYVSNYGGPSRLYELQDGLLMDAAPYVGSNLTRQIGCFGAHSIPTHRYICWERARAKFSFHQ